MTFFDARVEVTKRKPQVVQEIDKIIKAFTLGNYRWETNVVGRFHQLEIHFSGDGADNKRDFLYDYLKSSFSRLNRRKTKLRGRYIVRVADGDQTNLLYKIQDLAEQTNIETYIEKISGYGQQEALGNSEKERLMEKPLLEAFLEYRAAIKSEKTCCCQF